ncbi:MAG TPA: polysaccharide deacetylase family protein [bacterium]|nr:polysaccharide deacetylase family protein [bacterium]HOM26723.1 polysaccharide deacetylase family protein [bacterium]
MEKIIHIIWTMDCEFPKSPFGGPENWEIAEKSVNGFLEVLTKHCQKATFFVTPEVIQKKFNVFSEKNKNFEIGMHLHPFDDSNKKKLYMGQMRKEEQEKVLKENREKWIQSAGFEPRSFRPGNFSANDYTFPLLLKLGFFQGSVSSPYRKMEKFFTDWEGALLDPHHTNEKSRLIEGKLDFFEVPVTVDPFRKKRIDGTSYELRIEWGDISEHIVTIENVLKRLKKENPPVKSIVSITHNTFDYTLKNSKYRSTLEKLILFIQELIIKENFTPLSITIEELHKKVDGKDL